MASGLEIDAELTLRKIDGYLKDLIKRYSATGVLIGLSGGIDSSLLATLAVQALGNRAVHVSYLFDRDSEKDSEEKAQIMADWLGLSLQTTDISPAMRSKGVYSPLIMKLVPYSRACNRMIQYSYQFMFGETPFKSSLRVSSDEFSVSWLQRFIYDLSIRHIEKGFSERHIYRRVVLEDHARRNHLLLIGAANRSEFQIGWFAKGGIDDLPLQPLLGLYKTQVRQLAKHLGLPAGIQSQIASPDMMKGICDEFGIGHPYERLDIVLDCLDRGLSGEEILASGVKRKELDDIRGLTRLSASKRESKHEPPPVDGGIRGSLRKGIERDFICS